MNNKIINELLTSDPNAYPKVKKTLVFDLQFLNHSGKQFIKDDCIIRASGLAYTSLLALVPFFVVLFSFLSAVGSFSSIEQSIKQFLIDMFVPARQDQILEYFENFTENTGTLGAVGLGMFLVTSILLLNNIERNFNIIWGARSDRSFIDIVKVYTAVLVFGSILIGASFSISNLIRDAFRGVAELPGYSIFETIFRAIFPVLFIFLAFVMMIMVVPNGKVHFKSAVIGAIIGAILWEIAKRLFTLFVSKSITFSVVYGSLAAIPIFLIWLYLGWIIIMISLEVAYVHQNVKIPSSGEEETFRSPGDRIAAGIDLFLHIADQYEKEDVPPTATTVGKRLNLSTSEIESIISLLSKEKFILPVRGDEEGYVPARPLDSITMNELIDVIIGRKRDFSRAYLSPGTKEVLETMQRELDRELKDITVKKLITTIQTKNRKDKQDKQEKEEKK
ncbi:MAG: YihY family inner membrane protein [Spirochaetia bacterium]